MGIEKNYGFCQITAIDGRKQFSSVVKISDFL